MVGHCDLCDPSGLFYARKKMNELITVRKETIGNAVSARELYLGLGLDKSNWAKWFVTNIEENGFFAQGVDFVQLVTMTSSPNPPKDFAITIEFAKHLAMMAKTEKAHEYRNYFLECEKKVFTPVAKTLSSVLKDNLEIAIFFGLEGNNAKIAANTATRKLTGTDPMALLEITLVAPVQERTMTPSDIGVQLGLSGIKVNQLLKDIGYQVDSRDAKKRLVWTATAEGAKHSGQTVEMACPCGRGFEK
jgi:phage anti-repressor protein